MINDEFDPEENLCPSCDGAGEYPIGNCEDGVWETCRECNGTGTIDE